VLNWATSFDNTIRSWIRSDDVSLTAWRDFARTGDFRAMQELARRGQVDSTSEARVAMWEAFLYQRSHIDAMKHAVALAVPNIVKADVPVAVIDVGCGAGTTAFAFAECLPDTAIHYIGVDHNAPSRLLCQEMIGSAVIAQGGTFALAKSLREALDGPVRRLPPGARIYVACGYVLCQSDAMQIAQSVATSLIELADETGSVRIMIVDAALSRCQAKTVVRLLSDAPVRLQHRKDTLTVDLRFPRLDDDGYRVHRPQLNVERHIAVVSRPATKT
jgi:hypothetical protein